MSVQRVYEVTVHTTEEYTAMIVAGSTYEAERKARQGLWEDVFATGRILRNSVVRVRWDRDANPEDLGG